MTWRTKDTNPQGEPHHFYATSFASWKVNTNLDALVRAMKREGYPFNVFRLDLPIDSDYRIQEYTPQVDRSKIHFVGFWDNR